MADADLRETIYNRANGILLKLLDAVERDLNEERSPSAHLEAYEVLCRAETARRGV